MLTRKPRFSCEDCRRVKQSKCSVCYLRLDIMSPVGPSCLVSALIHSQIVWTQGNPLSNPYISVGHKRWNMGNMRCLVLEKQRTFPRRPGKTTWKTTWKRHLNLVNIKFKSTFSRLLNQYRVKNEVTAE